MNEQQIRAVERILDVLDDLVQEGRSDMPEGKYERLREQLWLAYNEVKPPKWQESSAPK